MIASVLVLIVTALTCGLLGNFLVLRKLSMVADAIAHSVLLGIVLAFFLTGTVDSPWLMIGATIFGVLTVAAIEALGKTKLVKYDDAIGVVFPVFFALAVILIDTDIVLMGEVIFVSLNTVSIGGLNVPVSFIRMLVLLIVNLVFVLIAYKELKVSNFDPEYAILAGVPMPFLYYSLMTLTSITTVLAFDAVGAILVLSFFIAPAASAYLLTKDLKWMIATSAIIATANTIIGSLLAIRLNTSMSGMCAVMGMITFMLVLFLHQDGVVARALQRRRTRLSLDRELFLIHLGNHELLTNGDKEMIYNVETNLSTIAEHLDWKNEKIEKVQRALCRSGLITIEHHHYRLTDKGMEQYEQLCREYHLQ